MTNPLDNYLRDCRIKGRDFAAATAIPEYDISKFRNGRKLPTLDQAFAIEDASGGAVPARSWVDLSSETSGAEHGDRAA